MSGCVCVQAFKPQEPIKPVTMAPVAKAPPPAKPTPPAPSPTFRETITARAKQPPLQKVDFTVEMPVPPQFVEPLKNLAAVEGTKVTLEGMVKGKPEPTVKWFKEGKEISDSADFQISYRNNRVSLTIPEIFEEDAGRYLCKAENQAGTQQSSAELIVKGMLVHDYLCAVTSSLGHV